MKWTTEDGNTLEVSYMSKRMWWLVIALLVILVLLMIVGVALMLYGFWWVDKNNVLSSIMTIMKGGCLAG